MSTTKSETTTDGDGWKQKYRDAVMELDARQSAWRDDETHLHKNLLRLSFSFQGLDESLDRRLEQLRDGLKKTVDTAARTALIDEIVEHITKLSTAADPAGNKPDPAATLVLALIGQLNLPDSYALELEIISSRLAGDGGPALQKTTARLAELLNEATQASADPADDRGSDTFVEFLSKFSFPGSLGAKVTALQTRSKEIKTDLERLAVIDDTIALIGEQLDQDNAHMRGTSETQSIVRELIEWMTLPHQVKDEIREIQSKLDSTTSEEDLSAILRDLGYTVSRFHSTLMSELTDVEYYLKNIALRLKELQLGIEDSFKDQRESLDEQEDLNSGISEQVIAIATKLADERDLNEVKHLIDEGLSGIRSRMSEHLERDRQRVANGEQRLALLSERLKKMDQESTRLRALVQQERERAQHDALTGVPNRAAYDERIATEIARRNRHGRSVSLAVIDIDKFKNVNDNFGHKAGDKVLKNVAEICTTAVRASDFMARYGGEEFVLILPETALDQARVVAEKLREEIAGKGFYYKTTRVPITVSIGVAEFAPGETADEVFQRADSALYAAKEGGRNRCVTESEID